METKNIMFIILLIIVFGGVLIFGWWMIRWQYSKADSMLDNWATQNNYKVLEKTDANVGDGPMGRRGASTFVKYRIKVQDPEGKIKTGIIILGNENTGVLSDEIKVNWDN
jgi:hypothetical protein